MINHQQVHDSLVSGVIGAQQTFQTPFGDRRIIYADWTASSRGLYQVERYVESHVLPLYGNTHTSSSITGWQTTETRENSRNLIAKELNCNEKDVVIFTGSGSTAAINKFVRLIELEKRCQQASRADRPVVFVGPYEHHSNLLPWRESGAQVVEIHEDVSSGAVDLVHLEQELQKFSHRSVLVGSFSAGSNVTGILTDTDEVAILLHKYNAIACFDYAGVAPYVPIDMNSQISDLAYKDAIFISPHKFIGGIGAAGLLIAKKSTILSAVPSTSGGGTVLYVTDKSHQYLHDVAEREEGGTPDIVGCIRSVLVFKIKNEYGVNYIEHCETEFVTKSATMLQHPNIVLLGHSLGDGCVKRLPILSFLIRCDQRYLHHNFVSTVLNDMYGIQSRSGCMCAGPYVIRLFGMDSKEAESLSQVLADFKYLKPGFTRLSLVYFNSDEEANFILQAIRDVATHAWKLLPQYTFDSSTDQWTHRGSQRVNRSCVLSPQNFTLLSIGRGNEYINSVQHCANSGSENLRSTNSDDYFQNTLQAALVLYDESFSLYAMGSEFSSCEDYESVLYNGEKQAYAWFVFPKNVLDLVLSVKETHGPRYDNLTPDMLSFPSQRPFVKPELYFEKLTIVKSTVSSGEASVGSIRDREQYIAILLLDSVPSIVLMDFLNRSYNTITIYCNILSMYCDILV